MRWGVICLAGFLLWTRSATGLAFPVAETFTFGGEIRNYLVYRPAGLDQAKPVPLLMVLHGSAGSGEDMVRITEQGFEKIAEKEKFIVVYPDAMERRWNDHGDGVDDAGFCFPSSIN